MWLAWRSLRPSVVQVARSKISTATPLLTPIVCKNSVWRSIQTTLADSRETTISPWLSVAEAMPTVLLDPASSRRRSPPKIFARSFEWTLIWAAQWKYTPTARLLASPLCSCPANQRSSWPTLNRARPSLHRLRYLLSSTRCPMALRTRCTAVRKSRDFLKISLKSQRFLLLRWSWECQGSCKWIRYCSFERNCILFRRYDERGNKREWFVLAKCLGFDVSPKTHVNNNLWLQSERFILRWSFLLGR